MITLATLNDATAQQVFDQVARHLMTQNAVSRGIGYGCLHRGPDGLKCAIGCLISDAEYVSDMEGSGIESLIMAGYVNQTDHEEMLSDLQLTHDDCDKKYWREALLDLAAQFNLSPSAIEEFKP